MKEKKYLYLELTCGQLDMLLNALIEKKTRNEGTLSTCCDWNLQEKYARYVQANETLIRKMCVLKNKFDSKIDN